MVQQQLEHRLQLAQRTDLLRQQREQREARALDGQLAGRLAGLVELVSRLQAARRMLEEEKACAEQRAQQQAAALVVQRHWRVGTCACRCRRPVLWPGMLHGAAAACKLHKHSAVV